MTKFTFVNALLLTCLLLLLVVVQNVHAQQNLKVVPGDTINLSVDSFRGDLIWEQSTDGINWVEIPFGTTQSFNILAPSETTSFRGKILEDDCNPHYSEVLVVESLLIEPDYKLWSQAATWNGNKPVAGQNVVIPEGTTILLDENPPALGGLTIEGSLVFKEQDLNLTAKWIMLEGLLQIGTESQPFQHKAIITLTGDDMTENVMGMGTRGLMVMQGQLELHGAVPSLLWTKISDHATKNSTSVQLKDNVSWNVGDEVAIAPTDYYEAGLGTSITQRVTLTGLTGNQLTLSQPLNAFRWGKLQYVTLNGMSESPTNIVIPPIANTETRITPTVLDERAEVANLTRNIVIQAPEDALWASNEFGVHIMISAGSTAHIEGIEIKRGGQRNRQARYAIHWHMLSSLGTQTLPDATGQYLKNSSINISANRGIVIHGTNGLLIQGNVLYNIKGHGIFTEDAVERRNTIDGNIVMYVRNSTQPLKIHEGAQGAERGSSGFWISNPDNTLINNIAVDCGTNGYWLAFTTRPWGLSSSVLDERDGMLLNPSRLLFGTFNNNTAHSNKLEGIMLDRVESSEEGQTIEVQYQSTAHGRQDEWPWENLRRFTMANYTLWKNGSTGFWDRAAWVDNYGGTSADNCGRFFAGSGSDGIIEQTLAIGTSLNHLMNGTDRPNFAGDPTPSAFATYHSTFDIKHNIIVNFPLVTGKRSGAFATEDYYTRPVDKGHFRNENNLLIASHTGYRVFSPYSYSALAGALWDPHGNWSGTPGSKWFVYNTPFFTHGQTPEIVAPDESVGGVMVEGPFYGFNDFVVNRANEYYMDLMAINVKRLDASFTEVGEWNLNSAQAGWALNHMRHFAARQAGFYALTFPSIDNVNDVLMSVENMLTADDQVMLSVEFTGAQDINQVFTSSASVGTIFSAEHANYVSNGTGWIKQTYTSVASREAVANSAEGGVFWQDKTNNVVWIKLRGGIKQTWNDTDYKPTDDELLYRLFWLRIF